MTGIWVANEEYNLLQPGVGFFNPGYAYGLVAAVSCRAKFFLSQDLLAPVYAVRALPLRRIVVTDWLSVPSAHYHYRNRDIEDKGPNFATTVTRSADMPYRVWELICLASRNDESYPHCRFSTVGAAVLAVGNACAQLAREEAGLNPKPPGDDP
jgi:hypothetical protein